MRYASKLVARVSIAVQRDGTALVAGCDCCFVWCRNNGSTVHSNNWVKEIKDGIKDKEREKELSMNSGACIHRKLDGWKMQVAGKGATP